MPTHETRSASSHTDRIEKQVVLRAPRARVWRALTDAAEFGTWFGVRLEGAFAPGARVKGRITTKGYEHVTLDVTVERLEPERLFSYRWHPYAVDPAIGTLSSRYNRGSDERTDR